MNRHQKHSLLFFLTTAILVASVVPVLPARLVGANTYTPEGAVWGIDADQQLCYDVDWRNDFLPDQRAAPWRLTIKSFQLEDPGYGALYHTVRGDIEEFSGGVWAPYASNEVLANQNFTTPACWLQGVYQWYAFPLVAGFPDVDLINESIYNFWAGAFTAPDLAEVNGMSVNQTWATGDWCNLTVNAHGVTTHATYNLTHMMAGNVWYEASLRTCPVPATLSWNAAVDDGLIYDLDANLSGSGMPGKFEWTFKYDVTTINQTENSGTLYDTMYAIPRVLSGGLWQDMGEPEEEIIGAAHMGANQTYGEGVLSWLLFPLLDDTLHMDRVNESLHWYYTHHPFGAPDATTVAGFVLNYTWSNGDYFNLTLNSTGNLQFQAYNFTQAQTAAQGGTYTEWWLLANYNPAPEGVAKEDVHFGVRPGQEYAWGAVGMDAPGEYELIKFGIEAINVSNTPFGFAMTTVHCWDYEWNFTTCAWQYSDPDDPMHAIFFANATTSHGFPCFLPTSVDGANLDDWRNETVYNLFEAETFFGEPWWDAYDPEDPATVTINADSWKWVNDTNPAEYIEVNWSDAGVFTRILWQKPTHVEKSLWIVEYPGYANRTVCTGTSTQTFHGNGPFAWEMEFTLTANLSAIVEWSETAPGVTAKTDAVRYVEFTLNDTQAIVGSNFTKFYYNETLLAVLGIPESALSAWHYDPIYGWTEITGWVNVVENYYEFYAPGFSVYALARRTAQADPELSLLATTDYYNVTTDTYTFVNTTTGHWINWTISDWGIYNTPTYAVARNGTIVASGTWTNWQTISVNLDALAAGHYEYVITVTDGWDGASQDTVLVEVLDAVDPVLTHPADVAFEVGEVGHVVSWTVTDPIIGNTSFTITRDGAVVRTGNWTTGTVIAESLNNLPVGQYNYILTVADGLQNQAADSVVVTVNAFANPTLTQPADLRYYFNTTGHTLNWTVTDPTVTAGTWSVTRNATALATGTWTSGAVISISIDNLTVGTWNFTLTVADGRGGTATDVVWVGVRPSPAGDDDIPGVPVVALVTVLAASVLVAARQWKRRQRQARTR